MTLLASAMATEPRARGVADDGASLEASVSLAWLQAGAPEADGRRRVRLPTRLDAEVVADAWRPLHALGEAASPTAPLILDAGGVERCDGAGLALLVSVAPQREASDVSVEGLRADLRALLDRLVELDLPAPAADAPTPSFVESTGDRTALLLDAAAAQFEFIGSVTRGLLVALRRPTSVRWREVVAVAREAGANAVGITSLLAFLLGLILAFESAVPLRRFGAEIFVANLLGLALLRELGPLITAILLSARSGAAFAAEFGAMKVNQEVDALVTMGLSPMQVFVLPRVIAGAFVAPLLTAFANLVGLLGGVVTMLAFQVPVVTFWRQLLGAVHLTDVVIGLAKAVVFGAIIAAAGCFRGGQTGSGAGAVGRAATSAVVTCIVLLVVVDGAIAVVLYALGL
jgi:phospholipid/cholesterol/gamma-HCH transport system permease protein